MKRDSQYPKLPYVGVQPGFADVPACELRNCPDCHSTLAKELPR